MRGSVVLGVVVVAAACGPGGGGLPDGRGDLDAPGGVDAPAGAVETLLAVAPASLSNESPAVFEFSADRPATFTCWIDGGDGVPCTSPQSVPVVDGAWTFEVRATSLAGVADPTPAAHAWTVDLTAPTVTLTAAPSGIDNSTTVAIEFTVDEPAQARCGLDGVAPAPCASPWSINVADGAHAIVVDAVDLAGNVGASVPAAWTVDTSTPDTVIDAGPIGVVASTAATFVFSTPTGGPGETYACELDATGEAPCTSPQVLSGLAQGPHTFRVTVRNQGGTANPTPAVRTWTVDTVAPTVEILAGPLPPLPTPTFTFAAGADATTIECRIDGAFAPCTSPFTGGPLADGSYVFEVQVADAAGNLASDATPFDVAVELACGDTVDNDGDTLADCADPDCAGLIECVPDCPAPTILQMLNYGALGIPLGGLVLHLRADLNVVFDSFGRACYWFDSSDGDHHVWQADVGMRPDPGSLGGQPALYVSPDGYWLGRTDVLGIPAAGARTVVVVAQRLGGGLSSSASQGGAGGAAPRVELGGQLGGGAGFACAAPGAVLEGDVPADLAAHVLTVTAASLQPGLPALEQLTCGLDGASMGLTSLSGPDPLLTSFATATETRVGGLGEQAIAEVLVYDRALSGAERADVETYLLDRYGLAVFMP